MTLHNENVVPVDVFFKTFLRNGILDMSQAGTYEQGIATNMHKTDLIKGVDDCQYEWKLLYQPKLKTLYE